ncbi:MAG: DNA gyrase inhibitor YacG [Pseudomonadota bacterium]|nr:DNA gyrase inhibitor YacG [Pseudomonadota bacterium]
MMSFKKAICAICDKPQVESYKPFCSAKCKLIDLGNWIDGDYRLPSEEVPSDAEILDISIHLLQNKEKS